MKGTRLGWEKQRRGLTTQLAFIFTPPSQISVRLYSWRLCCKDTFTLWHQGICFKGSGWHPDSIESQPPYFWKLSTTESTQEVQAYSSRRKEDCFSHLRSYILPIYILFYQTTKIPVKNKGENWWGHRLNKTQDENVHPYMLSQNFVRVLGFSWLRLCRNQRWMLRTSQSSCLERPSSLFSSGCYRTEKLAVSFVLFSHSLLVPYPTS